MGTPLLATTWHRRLPRTLGLLMDTRGRHINWPMKTLEKLCSTARRQLGSGGGGCQVSPRLPLRRSLCRKSKDLLSLRLRGTGTSLYMSCRARIPFMTHPQRVTLYAAGTCTGTEEAEHNAPKPHAGQQPPQLALQD